MGELSLRIDGTQHGESSFVKKIKPKTHVLAFHRISLFRSMASLDSMQGFGIFLGMMRPSGSSREAGTDEAAAARAAEAAEVEWPPLLPR